MYAWDGKIQWSISNLINTTLISGPVSVANGVLFVASTTKDETIYAINTKNGEIIWSYGTSFAVYGGVSISDGCLLCVRCRRYNNGNMHGKHVGDTMHSNFREIFARSFLVTYRISE